MDRLRDLRLDADLTQRQLGQAAGIPDATISRIECGHSHPRPLTQARIARALGVDRRDIWPDEDRASA